MKKNASRIFAFFAFACSFLTTCTEPFGKLDNPYDEKNGLFIEATSLRFASSTSEMYVGESRELSCRFNPSDATNTELVWTSTAESVVKIDQEGKATGLKIGKATITATNPFTKLSASVEITVTDGKVKSIELDIGSVNLGLNASRNLVATVLPLSAKDKSVSWTSSDSETVSVDDTGRVTGKRYGTATITAITTDGGKQASCVVTVVNPVPCTGIMLKGDDNSWAQQTIVVGENQTISVTYIPENTTQTELIWTSDNESVATVDSKGGVTGIAQGDTYITAKLKERPEISYSINLSVIDPDYLQSISIVTGLENGATPELVIGEALQLSYATVPENAPCTVTWSSDNPEIATVDQTGLVTAKQAGNIYISVTATQTNSNSRSNAKFISVIASRPAQSVEIVIPEEMINTSMGEYYAFTKNQYQLGVNILPENTTNKTVTWSSSDPSIATIDQNGLLTIIEESTMNNYIKIEAKWISGDGYSRDSYFYLYTFEDFVTGVSINTSPNSLSVGETFLLTANITPSYATNKDVSWSSDNENILSVSDNGLITALSTGEASITVQTKQGNYTGTKKFTIDSFPFTRHPSFCTKIEGGIAVSANGANIIMGADSSGSILYSKDRAKTWNEAQKTEEGVLQGITFSPDGSLAVGTIAKRGTSGSYIYTSEDYGATWIKQTASGLRNWRNIAISDDNQTIITSPDNGLLFISKDKGKTWTTVPNSKSLPWNCLAVAGTTDKLTIAALSNGIIYITHDAGSTWHSETIGTSFESRKICISEDGRIIKVFIYDTILSSTDGGINWTSKYIGSFPRGNWNISRNGMNIVISPSYEENWYISVDSGESWVTLNRQASSPRLTASEDFSIILFANDDGFLYTCDLKDTNSASLGITIPKYDPPTISILGPANPVPNETIEYSLLCDKIYDSVTWYQNGLHTGIWEPSASISFSSGSTNVLTVQVRVNGQYYSESMRITAREN